eukprot:TRINITY_DN17112_c0_g1_i1.p1 TRINITY_DN17112_c0_g1~~TRINITY_DN17112_c0_g1_i1.p1  ORF type:complete len:491 (-),score=88.53 TRINITY_DN17112_c0_g1_i1:698-2170(-)
MTKLTFWRASDYNEDAFIAGLINSATRTHSISADNIEILSKSFSVAVAYNIGGGVTGDLLQTALANVANVSSDSMNFTAGAGSRRLAASSQGGRRLAGLMEITMTTSQAVDADRLLLAASDTADVAAQLVSLGSLSNVTLEVAANPQVTVTVNVRITSSTDVAVPLPNAAVVEAMHFALTGVRAIVEVYQLGAGVVLDEVSRMDNVSCDAPLDVAHAATPSCLEGGSIQHGRFCTPKCKNPLYVATGPDRIKCQAGELNGNFSCIHSCDLPSVTSMISAARREHPFEAGVEYSGPQLWGSGLAVGPASLSVKSSAVAEWHAGLAPERWRFKSLGPAGPPDANSRRLASALAQRFAPRVCQQLIGKLWRDTSDGEKWLRTPAQRMLKDGCRKIVHRELLLPGWGFVTTGCGGAGVTLAESGNSRWCFIQDFTAKVSRHPELAEQYDPTRDALYQACEMTLGASTKRVAAYLEWQQVGIRDGSHHASSWDEL